MKPAERTLIGLLLALLLWPPAAVAAQLRLGSVLGETGLEDFARAREPRPFEFPRDHGPHPEYRSEWWYVTASLDSDAGERFGVQFTLFRQALSPQPVLPGPWDASQIYLGHLAVTDVAAARHLHAERLSRSHPRLAGVAVAPFRAWVDGWRLAGGAAGLESVRLQARTERLDVDLQLDALKEPVLQGDRGLSAKGPDQASYYYSLTRLAVSGTLAVDGEPARVTGSAWLDREWSTSVLSPEQEGWDWFGLQLHDGSELMAFQLRRESGVRDPYDQGVWVPPDGAAVQLRTQDFTLEPLRYWRDERGTAWPVAWRVAVMTPDGPRQLRVEAAIDDQRMDTLFTYWEGLVTVFDETGTAIGTGYMELTGYE